MTYTHHSGQRAAARQQNNKTERALRRYRTTKANIKPLAPDTLRIVPLGGQDGIGEKNMIVLEYGDDALILDCGFALGLTLPGINYAIPVVDYLETIRHKIKGYVISHGHMDHIGGLIHILPDFPAPVYGSRFTIGMVQAQFEKRRDEDPRVSAPDCHVIDMDGHQKMPIGQLTVELIRVTHAIPESSAIVVETPLGVVINTGDFRLDPEPLDAKPSDVGRLKQLGDKGVLLLMSESTNATKPGRTPTEHTLQDSFYDLFETVSGRLVVAVFSTNMNRVQMIINAAHRSGRKVALDGRSMIAVAELAVRLGNVKIPKDVLVPMREVPNLPDNQVVVICTGGQGEPGAALSRMAIGDHPTLKLKKGDTVVISSTPIPGNEQSYAEIGDNLARLGVKQYRHPTHELDGSGPLHVSGHASRDEHAEMIQLTRPQYLMPIYGGPLPRSYHRDIGLQQGMASERIVMAENGSVVEYGARTKKVIVVGRVSAGSRLVDQTGEVVSSIVTKDRLLLQDDGFLTVVVTINRAARLLVSADVVTRGLIAVKDNAEVLEGVRTRIRLVVGHHRKVVSRADIDNVKDELRTALSDYIVERTGHLPIVIPVVNVVASGTPSSHLAR